jgi:adenine-specific DNA-methyltransferase
MGAKHELAPLVAGLLGELTPGPCLDLFAGMCSVAGALAAHGRQAWCNDIQQYAALIGEALVATADTPPTASRTTASLFAAFCDNLKKLKERFADELVDEGAALDNTDYRRYMELADQWPHAGNDEDVAGECASLAAAPETFPYRLATLTFAYGYFGLRQAIELDSLRYAITAAGRGALLSASEARWATVALLQAASHLASTPGHFAEYLHARDEKTFRRIRMVRRRSVWAQFLLELERIAPYGTPEWRRGNRVFCREAEELSRGLAEDQDRPSVVYADPPYSKAQYSRYYHVLETLALYDYPAARSAGRYRPDGTCQ